MLIEQTLTIQAPRQKLWDFLIDVERMSLCVPGAANVKAVDDRHYEGALTVKIGPIEASFRGQAELLEVEAPQRLAAKGSARDERSNSLASATFTASLRDLAQGQTEVTYQLDLAVRGTFGKFGQGVMGEVAKRMTAEFAQCVETRLAGQPEPADLVPGRAAPARLAPALPLDLASTIKLDYYLPWLLVAGLLGFIIGYIAGSGSKR
jgi:carbon monoxide dehydrogenase subunit G